MPKRKAVIPSNEGDESEYCAEEDSKTSAKKNKVDIKQEEVDELESDEETPLARKKNVSPVAGTDTIIRCTSAGEKYIDLGKRKRATVRSFKGSTFVDIREFYVAEGEERPGKKGHIPGSRTALKRCSDAIDAFFTDHKK